MEQSRAMQQSRAMEQWSAVAPLSFPVALTRGYDRHSPTVGEQRTELTRLAAGQPWSELDWTQLLSSLLAIGRTDIPLSKLLESHVDALRILHQAGVRPAPEALYGVWASRSERTGVRATRQGSQLILNGKIRFASGSGVITRALLPVWPDTDLHLLIDLELPDLESPTYRDQDGIDHSGVDQQGPLHDQQYPTVTLDDHTWQTSAMELSRSHTLTFDDHPVPASSQIGPPNFYLSRREFFPGGVGVAACWLGGATRVADLVQARLFDPAAPSLQQRMGLIRIALAGASATLGAAGRQLSLAHDHPGDGRQLSTEVRSVVASAVHVVLDQAHRVAGPAGLAYDRDLTRAVHDLRLYVLQSNADADAAYLGGLSTDRTLRGPTPTG